jgi:hypothetical protein
MPTMYDGLFPNGTLLTAPSGATRSVDPGEDPVDTDREAGKARID